MKRISGVGFFPLLLVGLVAACLLTTCSTELLDEITADIEADIASKLPKKPEIKVSVGGSELYSGYGIYNYPGRTRADGDGGDSAPETFTVSNLGDGELTFSVSLSGSGASNFELDTTDMLVTLGPAGAGTDSTTFAVNFDPGISGTVTATVTVTSNDEDEAAYSFTVSGTAEWWGFQTIASVGDITSPTDYGQMPMFTFGSLLVVPEGSFFDGEEIMIAYTDLSTGNIMFTRSTDGGATWSTAAIAASWQVADYSARYSSLALDGDTVYLAFKEHWDNGSDPTDGELRLVKSADRGVTWGGAGDIGEEADNSIWDTGYYPSIGVDPVSKNVYIAHYSWSTGAQDLRFAIYDDSTSTWTTSIVDESTTRIGEYCSLKNIGKTIYIGYYDYNSGALKFAKGTDPDDGNPVTWTVTTADANFDRGAHTSLDVDGGSVYMSYFEWDTDSPGPRDLWFIESSDDGATWDAATDAVKIDSTSDVGYYSSIDVVGSDIYISYFDWGSGKEDLKFVHSADGGATWPVEPISPLQSTGTAGMYTNVKAAGNNVFILFYDQTNGNLMLAKSIDRGESW